MRQTILFKTGLAVLCGLILTATGLWAAGSSDGGDSEAAAEKKLRDRPHHRQGGERARVMAGH